jgi:lactate dehydrogenase-like 2-hydroxyacid dehydrogenase
MIKILSMGQMNRRVEQILAENFEVLRAVEFGLPRIIAAHGGDIAAILTSYRMPIDAELIAKLPKLELIANFGVGYESIDLAAAAASGVVVTNTPDVLNEEMGDFTIGLLLATIRQLPQAERHLRAGHWAAGRQFQLSTSLRGRHVGIAGMGRIGKVIVQRLSGFDVPISVFSRREPDGPFRYFDNLVDLAAAVDVLIVVLPGGAATRHIVDEAVLRALGENGVLINVARGSVVDEDALIAALRDGGILSAGLDVFEDEPQVREEFLAMENVVLLPHVGTATHHTRGLMGDLVVANVRGWFAGDGPVTPVPETPVPAGRFGKGF